MTFPNQLEGNSRTLNHYIENLETMDNLRASLTQKRSQFPPAEVGTGVWGFNSSPVPSKKTLDVERFLASLHFEHRGKLDQLGI